MALPKQVQKQADDLKKFEDQVAEANKPAEPTDGQQTTEPNPPADDVSNTQAKEPEVPAAPETKAEDAAVWEQRFKSLQGMYNSQVPTLQLQVKQLSEQLTTAIQALDEAKKAPAKPADPQEVLVTNKDVETFGEDLVDLARRIAKEEFGKREQQYVAKIGSLEQQLVDATGQVNQVTQAQSRSSAENFFDRLSTAVPNWESVQNTDECQQWLGMRVPGTELTWDDVLKDAASKHDLQRVVELFNTFFERYPKFNPKAPTPAKSNRAELERQVAPAKAKGNVATPQSSTRTYTGTEYQNESMRQVRLVQQGKYDEAVRLEAELNAALAEGRVTP